MTLNARLMLGGLLALLFSIWLTAREMSNVGERELLAQAGRREQTPVQSVFASNEDHAALVLEVAEAFARAEP